MYFKIILSKEWIFPNIIYAPIWGLFVTPLHDQYFNMYDCKVSFRWACIFCMLQTVNISRQSSTEFDIDSNLNQ